MTRVVSAREIAEGVAGGRLHVEVDATDETKRREEVGEGVDDGVEAGYMRIYAFNKGS